MLDKLMLYSTLLGFVVRGEVLQVKNNGDTELIVSVTGLKNLVVSPGLMVPVTIPDDFTGTITSIPRNSKGTDVPRTKVEMTLSPMGDAYDVSLIDGFNIKAKITPLQGRRCKTVACTAHINSLCSERNQVQDGNGTVLGCFNSPFLFKAVCPEAMVTSADVRNVFTCTADSYLITFG